MAYKMKGASFFGLFDKDKKILRKAKRKSIKNLRDSLKSGNITRKQFKEAKKEIRGYTDVDAAKDYLNEK
tara:strand:+ start:146 stop:355 length:210 start_codon:yes stop_codon:yes gene_type:complete